MKLFCPHCRTIICAKVGNLHIVEAGRGVVVAFEGVPVRWRCGKCKHEWIPTAETPPEKERIHERN